MDPRVAAKIPKLAPKVRLRWDEVRQKPMLVFPEGILLLKGTGYRVLELCDGKRALGEILSELQKEFGPSEKIEEDTLEFLQRLGERRFLLWEEAEEPREEPKEATGES
jgi:pyrroloquinoline quinone biosynthesis protein D